MKIVDLIDEISYPHASIDDTMEAIQKIMRVGNLDYLPLLDVKGKIFGIIDSSILAESYNSDTPKAAQNIWERCNRDVTVIEPESSISETVLAMQNIENHNGFIVVAEEGRYIGAVTTSFLVSKITVDHEGSQEAEASIDKKSKPS